MAGLTIGPCQVQPNTSAFQGHEHNLCSVAHHEHSDSLVPLIARHGPLVPELTDLDKHSKGLSDERTRHKVSPSPKGSQRRV